MMAILQKYKHILVLGRGGFGRQLGEMLESGGWGTPVYLDDNAPGCAGMLRDYVDPRLRRGVRQLLSPLETTPCAASCCKN